MSASDRRLEERIVERLTRGAAGVTELLADLRGAETALLARQEGGIHALLHRLVRDRVAHPVGHGPDGGTVYATTPRPDGGPAADPAADLVAAREAPPPVPAGSTRLALRVASGARDAEDRGRIIADVLAHDAALRAAGTPARFGSWKLARGLVRAADRGRSFVAVAATTGERARRFLALEGLSLASSLAAVLLLWLFVAEFRVIPSNSMRRTLAPGDRVLVKKLGGRAVPDRWDVVVFRGAKDVFVKRAAGLPGEELQLVNGDLVVDGVVATKPDALAEAVREPVLRAGAATGPDFVPVPGTEPTLRRHERALFADEPRYADPSGALERVPSSRPLCHDVHLFAATRGAATLGIELVSADSGTPANAIAAVAWSRDAAGVERVVLRRGAFAPAGEEETVLRAELGVAEGDVTIAVLDGELRVVSPRLRLRHRLDAPRGRARILVGGGVAEVGVDRDLHYTSDPQAAYGVEAPYRVPTGHVFFLGDHSFNSRDSRYREVGPVPLERLIGPVVFRVWPPSRIGPVR